ncbi:MAG: hypothetical protein ACTSV7_06465, partial [Candidatus Baldrarchaeia archaeon]
SRVTELRCYGLIFPGYIQTLSNTTNIKVNGVIYMGSLNVLGETVVGDILLWNTSDLQFLYDVNVVYTNGGSEVLRNES